VARLNDMNQADGVDILLARFVGRDDSALSPNAPGWRGIGWGGIMGPIEISGWFPINLGEL
jgi:hypothetical protein